MISLSPFFAIFDFPDRLLRGLKAKLTLDELFEASAIKVLSFAAKRNARSESATRTVQR
jgi:hypothetical protein